MGKKLGACCFAIKRTFITTAEEKPTAGLYKKKSREKKKQKGETKSFISLFKEPSSIEEILGEADHQLLFRPRTPIALLETQTAPRIASPEAASYQAPSAKPHSPAAGSSTTAAVPKVAESRERNSYVQNPEPTSTSSNKHLSATMIQAAYRGYMVRQHFRSLGGLARLQEVVRGQNVYQQTTDAMKQMQLMVRVQTQIQSQRIQNLGNKHQRDNKEEESTLIRKSCELSEAASNYKDWDNSFLTKEEVKEKLQKKTDAAIKRERAMSYAYSLQLQKSNAKSAQSPLDIRTNGNPLYWNYKPKSFTFNNHESVSSRSLIPVRARPSAANSAYDSPLKDDDIIMSCPPFSSVSAKTKVRPKSNPKERLEGSPSNDSKKRSLSPLTPKRVSRNVLDEHESSPSIDELSVDSAIVGRKPFNRFV